MCVACAATTVLAKAPKDNGMPESVRPEVAEAVAKAAARPHPRLFADAAGFARIKERIGKDGLLTAAAEHVRAVADMMLPTSPSQRIKEGKRLLGVSRTALYRISTLAMAYRLYGDKSHLDRAIAEMPQLGFSGNDPDGKLNF